MTRIEIAGETVELRAERALYWPREETLFIADTHWGKAATFRAMGAPVPRGTTTDDLARLGRALDETGARRLIVLGDLLHARAGRSVETLHAIGRWFEERPKLERMLVRGNHDKHAGDPPREWGFRVVDEPTLLEPFVLRHRPSDDADGYVLAGHVHPKIRLTGPGAEVLKPACFEIGPRSAVLPAFTSFADGGLIRPRAENRYFAVVDDEVIEVG